MKTWTLFYILCPLHTHCTNEIVVPGWQSYKSCQQYEIGLRWDYVHTIPKTEYMGLSDCQNTNLLIENKITPVK
jgi:hypothetical protein